MDVENEREYWLHDMGYARFKPAYYELTEEQRSWLRVSNTDPYTKLGEVLEELPDEKLKTLIDAYEPLLNDPIIDAEILGQQMVEDAMNMGANSDNFELFFPLSQEEVAAIDPKVLDRLLIWGREDDRAFYEEDEEEGRRMRYIVRVNDYYYVTSKDQVREHNQESAEFERSLAKDLGKTYENTHRFSCLTAEFRSPARSSYIDGLILAGVCEERAVRFTTEDEARSICKEIAEWDPARWEGKPIEVIEVE